MQEYVLARGQYEDVIQDFPASAYVEEARWKIGRSAYALARPYDRDQTETEEALKLLQEFRSRLPGESVQDGRRRRDHGLPRSPGSPGVRSRSVLCEAASTALCQDPVRVRSGELHRDDVGPESLLRDRRALPSPRKTGGGGAVLPPRGAGLARHRGVESSGPVALSTRGSRRPTPRESVREPPRRDFRGHFRPHPRRPLDRGREGAGSPASGSGAFRSRARPAAQDGGRGQRGASLSHDLLAVEDNASFEASDLELQREDLHRRRGTTARAPGGSARRRAAPLCCSERTPPGISSSGKTMTFCSRTRP